MKIRNLFILMFVAFCAVSCGSDDDEKVSDASVVAGSYVGSSSATFKYVTTPMVTTDDTLTIKATADNTLDITYRSSTWGTMKLTNALVARNNTTYTITGNGTIMMEMNGSKPKNYECTFSALMTCEEKNTKYVITIPSVMGGLVITFAKSATI